MKSRDLLKPQLMAGTIGIALLALVGWAYAMLSDSRAAESAAWQDLADCRELTARIQALRQRPAVAGTHELGAADLSRQIEQAAEAADFAPESIVRIEPEPARRVGESNYLQVPTQLQLRRLTMQQVFTFLHALTGGSSKGGLSKGGSSKGGSSKGGSSKLTVGDIRLSAPRGEENGDHWTVEATLLYTVYSPKVKDESPVASAIAQVQR